MKTPSHIKDAAAKLVEALATEEVWPCLVITAADPETCIAKERKRPADPTERRIGVEIGPHGRLHQQMDAGRLCHTCRAYLYACEMHGAVAGGLAELSRRERLRRQSSPA